jgi:hypothetical protein
VGPPGPPAYLAKGPPGPRLVRVPLARNAPVGGARPLLPTPPSRAPRTQSGSGPGSCFSFRAHTSPGDVLRLKPVGALCTSPTFFHRPEPPY